MMSIEKIKLTVLNIAFYYYSETYKIGIIKL